MWKPIDDAVIANSGAQTSTGFLCLPREIRDQIYDELISIPSITPTSPENAGPRYEESRGGYSRIYHPPEFYPRTIYQSLLESNRQIETEIQALIREKCNLNYTLDVMFEYYKKDKTMEKDTTMDRMWPTWTHYPAPIKDVNELQLNLRRFGRYYVDTNFIGPVGSHIIFNLPVFVLLNRLFHHGPQFIYRGPFHGKVHIDTLTVTVWDEEHPARLDEQGPASTVFSTFSLFAKEGAFGGKINRIRVRAGSQVKEVKPEYFQRTGVAPSERACRNALVIWGIEPSSELPTDVL